MFTKTTGLLIVPLWMAAMGWLAVHDVWPELSAFDAKGPPVLQVSEWLETEGRQSQYTISDSYGSIGNMWTEYRIDDVSILRTDVVWIDRLSLDITPLRIIAHSVYTGDGVLDEFTLRLDNPDVHLRLHGERFHADFSFKLEGTGIGRLKSFKIPLRDAGLITGAFNPFSQLSDLEVGRRWRMQIFNPVAAVTGIGSRFMPMLVEVTGQEDIATANGKLRCWIVETANSRALVDPNGSVRSQEMTLPVVGRLIVARQDRYDKDAASNARLASFRHRRGNQP